MFTIIIGGLLTGFSVITIILSHENCDFKFYEKNLQCNDNSYS